MSMVARMQQSSSCFDASSNSMESCSETEVKRHHNIDSRLKIVKNGSSYGKKFLGAPYGL